jgi:cytoskeletal protein RodZ
MASIGQELRKARELQHLTLSQVAEMTKIRSDHLQAIEEGRFEVFPAVVYVRGSVRTYATLLKLDVPALMASLDAALSQKRGAFENESMPRSRGFLDFTMLQMSKLGWKTSVVIAGTGLAALVLGCSYFFWRYQRSVDPLKNLKPGLYQSTQTLSGQTLPLPAPKR